MIDLKALPWFDVKNTNRIGIKRVGEFDVGKYKKVYYDNRNGKLYNSKAQEIPCEAWSLKMLTAHPIVEKMITGLFKEREKQT